MILPYVERATREHQATAQRDQVAAFGTGTLAAYRRFLAAVYHFEYAIEAKLVYVPDIQLRFLATRLRSGLAGDDLLALGLDSSVLAIFARPIEIPPIESAAHALGWIYVLQCNRVHHDRLAARVPVAGAARYLAADLDEVGQRWSELGVYLHHVASRADEVVAAACDAFEHQRRWYREVAAPSTIEVATLRQLDTMRPGSVSASKAV